MALSASRQALRNAKIQGRRASMRALKQDMDRRLQDTASDASAKDLRISELELENQYLSGERLRPTELVVTPLAPAREKTRRARATPAPESEDAKPPRTPRRRTPRR